MSDDPFTQRLRQFTPDGTGLDRDALLFAAGRASATANQRWQTLAGALAASQLLTLGMFLWARPAAHAPGPFKGPPPSVAVEPPLPPGVDAPALWTLRERILAAEGDLPAQSPTEPLVPSEPPLRAFGPLPPELLN